MSNGIVSVIIPVYNRPRRLKEAVMSALLQTYHHIEIIIVNDGSTDDTKSIAEEMASKWGKTIIVLSQKNSGPGLAREFGTMACKGEYIQYLDSDDILLDSKFEVQVNAFLENPGSGICYGISYQIDCSFNPPLMSGPLRSTGEKIAHLFPKLLNERWWTTSCPLYKRDTVKTLGPWRNFLNEEDWEFDARAARLQTLLLWVPTGVSIRRINLSQDHLSAGGYSDIRKLSDRVIAKQLLLEYALSSGMDRTQSEMRTFARECFFMSRQCAVIGMEEESEIMFKLSRTASGKFRRNGVDYLVYSLLGSLIGWSRTGRLTSTIRNML
jgi:glycosyltransferase involved in cell wall biosynthesis